MKRILLLNGPNLNLLGKRNTAVYGSSTLDDIVKMVTAEAVLRGYEILALQSNHEGQLIDWIQENVLGGYGFRGIILNAGGYTHTSVALRDAVEIARDLGIPTIEVHLSDIHKRETFRHVSLMAAVCIDQVAGHGPKSYTMGLTMLLEYIEKQKGSL